MMAKIPQGMGFYFGQTPKQLHCAHTALKPPPTNERYKWQCLTTHFLQNNTLTRNNF